MTRAVPPQCEMSCVTVLRHRGSTPFSTFQGCLRTLRCTSRAACHPAPPPSALAGAVGRGPAQPLRRTPCHFSPRRCLATGPACRREMLRLASATPQGDGAGRRCPTAPIRTRSLRSSSGASWRSKTRRAQPWRRPWPHHEALPTRLGASARPRPACVPTMSTSSRSWTSRSHSCGASTTTWHTPTSRRGESSTSSTTGCRTSRARPACRRPRTTRS